MEVNRMFYKNARIFCDDFTFRHGAFEVVDGKFGAILPETVPEDAIDLGGATVIPGLIDVHSHGAAGFDFSDGDYEGLKAMAGYYAGVGVTSFAPASMTLPYDVLEKAFGNAKRLVAEQIPGLAVLRGIQMEGPYFSYKKRGAQNADYLKEPDFEGFKALYDSCDGLIRIVDIAPELPGAAEFTEKASKLCTVSVAHTDSDYDHAKATFDAGATHLTHLYNAMPPVHHRTPGVIPAASENAAVRAEIIADGYHIHPASVRLAFAMFKDRMILVSDSGRCAGQEEGYTFDLGGQMAEIRGGVAKLVGTDTIACSAANLWQCLQNVLSWNVNEAEAIRAATYNPACAIGAEAVVGSIAEGKVADFLICSPDYSEKRVFLAGKEL
jgi:N-acetylglucosamine-6-phosphate deacetylase